MSDKESEVFDDIDDDYAYSRSIYYKILEVGKENIEAIAELAKDSEHPRAFEVLSTFMKNMADVNDKLIELQRRKQIVDSGRTPEQKKLEGPATAFSGSSEDVLRMLEDRRNSDKMLDAEFEEINEDV
jgi:vacuolar-type H+-ATPase subunit E/Vma4